MLLAILANAEISVISINCVHVVVRMTIMVYGVREMNKHCHGIILIQSFSTRMIVTLSLWLRSFSDI